MALIEIQNMAPLTNVNIFNGALLDLKTNRISSSNYHTQKSSVILCSSQSVKLYL